MKPIFKYALRLFLIMTLVMILTNIVGGYFFDEELKMSGIIFKSVFFGFFMSAFFTSVQRYNLISSGVTEITEENLKAYCEGEIFTSLHPDEIIHIFQANNEFKVIEKIAITSD